MSTGSAVSPLFFPISPLKSLDLVENAAGAPGPSSFGSSLTGRPPTSGLPQGPPKPQTPFCQVNVANGAPESSLLGENSAPLKALAFAPLPCLADTLLWLWLFLRFTADEILFPIFHSFCPFQ